MCKGLSIVADFVSISLSSIKIKDKVIIKRVGNAVVLLPYEDSWSTLFDSLEQFSDNFMAERQQPELQERDSAFE